MGFFRMFKKEEKTYSLAEAVGIIEKESAEREASRRKEIYAVALRVNNELPPLALAIKEFSKKPAPPQARSSEKVRDRFCEIAVQQIAAMQPPSAAEPQEFLRAAHQLINGLGGLTERQLLHLGIFFQYDIQPVAKKMKEINNLLHTEAEGNHKKVLALFDEIKALDATLNSTKRAAAELESALARHESRKSSIITPSEHTDNSSLLVAERRLQRTRQEVDSLLAVQKFLRKYVHAKNLHDELIDEYLDSPSSALLHDEHFRIIKIIMEARAYDDTGKAESVISRENEVRARRTELGEAVKEVDREKQKYETASSHAASRAMEARRKLVAAESELRDASRSLAEEKEKLDILHSDITRKKTELMLLASSLLDAKITL
ncbi:MAG TPA: hypothetical protein VJI12_02050 [archaeon]|nr:hypothetical protein [archaeon]